MVYREQNFSFPLNCKIAAYRGKEPQIFSTILPQPSQRLISRNPDTFQYARPPIYVYIYIGSLNKAATQFRIRLAIRGREEQRENFISRRARGLETVVKVVDVPPYFERQNRGL